MANTEFMEYSKMSNNTAATDIKAKNLHMLSVSVQLQVYCLSLVLRLEWYKELITNSTNAVKM